jgi:hypothetical protein
MVGPDDVPIAFRLVVTRLDAAVIRSALTV